MGFVNKKRDFQHRTPLHEIEVLVEAPKVRRAFRVPAVCKVQVVAPLVHKVRATLIDVRLSDVAAVQTQRAEIRPSCGRCGTCLFLSTLLLKRCESSKEACLGKRSD